MKKPSPIYSTNRMVAEYAERFYIPAAARHLCLASDKKRVHSLMDWRRRVHAHGTEVHITEVAADAGKTEFRDLSAYAVIPNNIPLDTMNVMAKNKVEKAWQTEVAKYFPPTMPAAI